MITFFLSAIIIILFFIIFKASKFIYSTIVNPVSIYSTMWLGFTFISCLGLWDMYTPSAITLIIILISVLSFCMASFFTFSILKKGKHKEKAVVESDIIPKHNYLSLVTLNLAAIAWLLQFVVKMFPIINAREWALARYYYLNANTVSVIYTTRQSLISQWIVFPIFYATTIFSAYLVGKRRMNVFLLLLSIINIGLIVIATAGRNPIFKMLCFYGFAIVAQSDVYSNLWKRITGTGFFIKLIGVCGIIMLIYISAHRSITSDSSVLQNVVYYFTGPIIYFNNIIENPQQFALFSEYLFGRATFGFISTPIEIIYSIITGNDYLGADNIITSYVNAYYNFSPTIRGNAVSTALYPFMKDFGFVGSVIGPIILAVLVNWVYVKALMPKGSKNSSFWNCINIYMLYVVLFSEWQYDLLFPQSFSIMLMLYIFTAEKPIKIKVRYKSKLVQRFKLQRSI